MKNDVKFLLAAALFMTLVFSIAPGLRVAPGFDQGVVPTEDPRAVAVFMFGPYALPLVVLSTALLVALVGALVLAKPDRTEDEQP